MFRALTLLMCLTTYPDSQSSVSALLANHELISLSFHVEFDFREINGRRIFFPLFLGLTSASPPPIPQKFVLNYWNHSAGDRNLYTPPTQKLQTIQMKTLVVRRMRQSPIFKTPNSKKSLENPTSENRQLFIVAGNYYSWVIYKVQK